MIRSTVPINVKLPDYINQTEFTGCDLNPVVVLRDFRKSLKKTLPDTPPTSPSNNKSEKDRTHSILADIDPYKSLKIKNGISIMLTPPRYVPNLTESYSKQYKPVKRKRESWDPSVEYEIEKIVGYHRDKRSKMWYFVKWKNWDSQYNTYEPIENLTGCNYELMKFFEATKPTREEIKKKNSEVIVALKKRKIYKKLKNSECKVEDFAEFSREFPDFIGMFKLKNLDALERRIKKEYEYIIRCLIGMYFHQDPGLIIRGQNYKLFLKLIKLRRKQLNNLTLIEGLINNLEDTKIVVENTVDFEKFPKLDYIVEVKPGDGVFLLKDPLLGCNCPSGCNYKSLCCGKMGDSIFAYNNNGKLRTSRRIPIYECNSRCHCPSTCPNRVVQRGSQVSLCIFKTKSCGWGVKALEKISKGTFVCEYIGELIPDSEAVVRDISYLRENKSGYLFDLDYFKDSNLDMYCIDATKQGNVARFINHSCDPNLVVYPVWVDGLQPNMHRLAFFAKRNIQRNEEIRFDYENLDELPVKQTEEKKISHGLRMLSNVKCQCKATNCRKWVFGNK